MDAPTFTVTGPTPAEELDERALRAMAWNGEVDLDQLLQYALPAYGQAWAPALTSLCQSPGDLETIRVLASELATAPRGIFNRPVVVRFTDPEDWDDDDEQEDGPRPIQPRVGNGMHRIAASLLAGATRMLVACRPQDTSMSSPLVRVRGRMSGPENMDVFDFAAEWLRSFRLTPQVWVETDGSSCIDGVHEWLFYCPHELQGELGAALVDRAAQHGVHLDVLEVTATTWAQLEDGDPAE